MHILGDIFEGDYPISQYFGADPEYYGQFTIYGVKQKGHEGVDWATPVGAKIIAPFDGIVLRQDYQNDYRNYGKVVVLWDAKQKIAVWFAHLSEEYTNDKQSFKKGEVLGKTGITGNVSGPHLHFGIVETDQYGNRLNAYDGYGGFINPLDTSKIKWVLGQNAEDPYVAKFAQLKISIDRLKSETDILNANSDKKSAYDATMSKVKNIAATGSL